MTMLVHLALLGWIAGTVLLWSRLPRRQALVAVFVLGVLFLPEIHRTSRIPGALEPLSFPGFKLTKINAISYGVLIASLTFDSARWLSFRLRWFDLPVLVWCVCPLFSSLANELGPYDGISELLEQTLVWGIPYFMGRLYLGDPAGLRTLVVGIVLGALLYVPFCLCEVRLSPQLHLWVYGFHQHEFQQTIRFGGYRPMVFMEHGLAVSLWMTAATLLAFWLYRTGAMPRLPRASGPGTVSTLLAVGILLPATLLCRSLGPLVVGTAGFGTLLLSRRLKSPVPMIALLMVAPLYIGLRTSSAWTGEGLVGWVDAHVDAERAQSLEFRLANEDLMVTRALESPVFGWGGWGRNLVYTKAHGDQESVTDGGWILALGRQGGLGLTAFCLTLLLPAARFTWRYPPRRWSEPALAPAAATAVLLAMVVIDKLLNDMVNPVFMLAAGSLAGLTCWNVPETGALRTAPGVVPSAQPRSSSRESAGGPLPWRSRPVR